MSPELPSNLTGPMTDFMGIPVRSAVSIILALEKCVSWAFNQSSQWCRLKSSCDTCLSPRASANSGLHSRSSRSISFIFSRYRVRLISAGLSTLSLITTELWGCDDSASSASIGVEPSNLVRLLLELSQESTLAPRRLIRGLVARKGGFGSEPNVNWAVSSRSASSALMCLWKTLFNHSTPLGLSKWIPSEDATSGKDRSIWSATSNNLTGRTLL